jgi:hypothetical protein
VVVGLPGVLCLDSKDWRGVVSADGQGELLCKGKPLEEPYVRQLAGRVMGIKGRVKALAPGLDPYFKTVFVFTSARVEADWGTTKSVHCIRDEQLFKYIVEGKKGERLTKEEVNTIAHAFVGLAHMDTHFTDKAEGNGRPRPSAIHIIEFPAIVKQTRRMRKANRAERGWRLLHPCPAVGKQTPLPQSGS